MEENKWNICPACEHTKEYTDKIVCKYCFYRGTVGAYKLIVLNIFNNIPHKLSTLDLMKELDTTGIFKKKANRSSVRNYLWYLAKQGLLTKSKERRKTKAKPQYLYKITARGKKRLIKYNNRWKKGLPPIIKTKKHKPLTLEQSARAASIRGLIIKKYPLYQYIMPARK